MQFRPFVPGVEVFGGAIELMLNSFRILPSVAMNYLGKFGLASVGSSGRLEFDRDRWHPQDAWLRMFEAIANEVGLTSLFEIGRQVGAVNVMAAPAKDIQSRMLSIDIGYHVAHRRDGKVMYDRATGMMLEGIGHYTCNPHPTHKKIVSVCDTPYPCDFDFGIITSTATQFQPRAQTIHDAACRKRGDDRCIYVTTW